MPSTDPLGPMIRMKAVRKLTGLTLVQVADRMGEQGFTITEAGLSNVENGNKQASDRFLIAWAKALGLDQLDVWHGPLRTPVKPGVPERVGAVA